MKVRKGGQCEQCRKPCPKKRRFCSTRCAKQHCAGGQNSAEGQTSERERWKRLFLDVVARCHTRQLEDVVNRLLRRIDATYRSMEPRSKKAGVPCTVTVAQLRELVLAAYGTPCRYCGKIMTLRNFVFDHRIPISKGGASDVTNLQLICRTSNGVKGSLSEEHFLILLKWLAQQPEALAKDIRVRLARGVR